MALDPNVVNEELKIAREAHVSAVVNQLNAARRTREAYENARAVAASKMEGGKPPSEAACERAAKSDKGYLAACAEEPKMAELVMRCDVEVEYLRKKFEVALALAK